MKNIRYAISLHLGPSLRSPLQHAGEAAIE